MSEEKRAASFSADFCGDFSNLEPFSPKLPGLNPEIWRNCEFC
jgi:hypothetical protein